MCACACVCVRESVCVCLEDVTLTGVLSVINTVADNRAEKQN